MTYDPEDVIRSYAKNAEIEDQAEKSASLRTEIPREFIKRYIKPNDNVLDAGGGTGINAIMMARICEAVTLLDITPRILEIARKNVLEAGLQDRIEIMEGDICDLSQFHDEKFSFVTCVGDSLSYVLDRREEAIGELVRVAKRGSNLILGGDSKYGFLRLRLAQGKYEEAIEILNTSVTTCGMGPKTHLYTIDEMRTLLEGHRCRLLEIASTPSVSDTFDTSLFIESKLWDELKEIELKICTQPELLGVGLHLLFVVQKE
jgi:SAM-dependent methyltransferase